VHEVNYLTKPIYEMQEFPEHLARLGHEVGFLHFPEGYRSHEVRSLGWTKRIRGRVISDSRLTLFTPPFPGGLAGRLITAVTAHYFVRKAILDFCPQLVVCYSVPTNGWQAVRVAKKFGVPLMFRALDVSHKIRKDIFSQLIFTAEQYMLRNASWVSANNPAMLEYCQSMGAVGNRSSVDWPLIDLERFKDTAADIELKQILGVPKDHKVILYMGSFFYFSGLPEVLEEFARSAEKEHLVLIGGGEQDTLLRRQVARLEISRRVTFTGYVKFDDLPRFLKLADVAINPMHPSLVSNAAIPNKVIQYLASGLVVVSTRLRGLELTFKHSKVLHLVDAPAKVVGKALAVCRGANESREEAGLLDLERFSLSRAVTAFESRCSEVQTHD